MLTFEYTIHENNTQKRVLNVYKIWNERHSHFRSSIVFEVNTLPQMAVSHASFPNARSNDRLMWPKMTTNNKKRQRITQVILIAGSIQMPSLTFYWSTPFRRQRFTIDHFHHSFDRSAPFVCLYVIYLLSSSSHVIIQPTAIGCACVCVQLICVVERWRTQLIRLFVPPLHTHSFR